MRSRRQSPIPLSQAVDEMDPWACGRCYCDEPPPGESGTIECTNCAVRRWQRAVKSSAKAEALTESLAHALKECVDSSTLLLTGRCTADLLDEQKVTFARAYDVLEAYAKARGK